MGGAPIITTDIVYGTGELLYDIYDSVWGYSATMLAAKGLTYVEVVAPLLPADPLSVICKKVGIQKAVVVEKWTAAQATVLQGKVTLMSFMASAYDPLNSVAVSAIDFFERLM